MRSRVLERRLISRVYCAHRLLNDLMVTLLSVLSTVHISCSPACVLGYSKPTEGNEAQTRPEQRLIRSPHVTRAIMLHVQVTFRPKLNVNGNFFNRGERNVNVTLNF